MAAAHDGQYLFADFVCGIIWRFVPASGGVFTRQTFATGLVSPVALAFGPYGSTQALYYTRNGGEVRRIRFVGTANRVRRRPSFSATPSYGDAPLLVQFDGRGSSDPDGDALTYAWDFGDGRTATGDQISHTRR